MTKFSPLQPIVVISTHLDDAVLSCAQFIHAHSDVTVIPYWLVLRMRSMRVQQPDHR